MKSSATKKRFHAEAQSAQSFTTTGSCSAASAPLRGIKRPQYVRYQNAPPNTHGDKYILLDRILYFSKRYGKFVECRKGMRSDGATGAKDLRNSRVWWVHDRLCNACVWRDGSPCVNLQASLVVYDILKEEGHWFRARTWMAATFLLGGWRIKRLNGWVKLKKSTPFRAKDSNAEAQRAQSVTVSENKKRNA